MSATSTGLGYATTIHAAQGVSADTMHGLVTGQESRQQLYTMLTRGRAANHLYLQVVGDGDPHTLIRPETVAPRTPTETLQQILARDDAPTSATTLLRELSDPAARLFDAVQRYTDGLHVAAEQLVGPQIVQMLDSQADQVVPELTSEPSWPTLRAHLLALAAETGEHPLLHLHTAAAGRELHTAGDMAAVLDWRLPDPAATDPGPLPWLPGIPEALHDHPVWGEYLAKRAELIADLAAQVRRHANQDSTPPVWATPGSHPSVALIGEVEVWRAANGDRPEGPPTNRSRTTADRGRPLATPPRPKCCGLQRRPQSAGCPSTPGWPKTSRARRSTTHTPATRHPPELAARPRPVGAPRCHLAATERTGYRLAVGDLKPADARQLQLSHLVVAPQRVGEDGEGQALREQSLKGVRSEASEGRTAPSLTSSHAAGPGPRRVFVVIMASEAAARPREPINAGNWRAVSTIDNSRREYKVSTTRLNGVFVPASDDLDIDSRTHSASLVQGVGMLLARHRYRVTGIVVASNMTSPSTAGR